MKKVIFLAFITVLIGTACKKQRKDYEGEAEVFLNGSKYVNKLGADNATGLLYFELYQGDKINDVLIIKRSLIFSGIKLDMSLQQLQREFRDMPRAGFTTSEDDGCIIGDIFDIDTSGIQNNYIQITKQKDNYHEIWGEFRVKLIRTHNCNCTDLPDTIEFSKGTFHILFKD